MPLVPSVLASSLENEWLVPEGGSYPSSVSESGDRFASCVARWFAQAMAAGFPCATATARQSQLAASATGAFSAQSAATAGNLLGTGCALYMAGQVFGPGASIPPAGMAAAQAGFVQLFLDLDQANAGRAQRAAQLVHALALTTIVVFPVPPGPPPTPVT